VVLHEARLEEAKMGEAVAVTITNVERGTIHNALVD